MPKTGLMSRNITMAPTPLWMTLAAVLLAGCPGHAHNRGLYATEAEAKQRAEQIGCTSIHQNKDRWMPCANERELHQQLRKQ